MPWPLVLIATIIATGSCGLTNTQPPGEGVAAAEDTDAPEVEASVYGKDTNTSTDDLDERELDPVTLNSNNSFSDSGYLINGTSSNEVSSMESSTNEVSSNSSLKESISKESSDVQAHLLAAKCMGSLLLFYFVTCLYLASRAGPLVVH
ncbi:uncharacterized protein LOC124358036 isoform X4 [Homalodisca vitripennis]|uniref:uncharacterized protein LOC124358036 isoform X1 n=1 Tax=Homalodisca vitripennis TaxID=197043 RepID=UPI001EEB0E17|nr:uncharacterized protein LOC124358036 isoform X1 [Homalodisca vitripennis]XP_046666257.1 uncharacterized protein LOC124358036 isoform X2 [Homalodisca vitripennis]XP_046666258.1 uncharacterized protein LOC124358036 isoform X3 [Homalodisca vitripennis]XP_046666259.1 uncharacterized protein LOC124358036 isoform X4 [Homalodisca vitripennis]